jgi:hypothetical protein
VKRYKDRAGSFAIFRPTLPDPVGNLMEPAAAEISRIVEYSRDQWTMARVPLALLFCLTGLAICGLCRAEAPGAGVPTVFGLLMASAVVVAHGDLRTRANVPRPYDGDTAAGRSSRHSRRDGAALERARRFLPSGPVEKLPTNLFGWMLVAGGIGWITHALYRHLRPARRC